jgi:hypothetical protein
LSFTIIQKLDCLQQFAKSVPIRLIEFNETICEDLKSVWHLRSPQDRLPFVVEYRLYYTELVSEDFIISLDTDLYAGRYFIPELFDIVTSDANRSLIYAVHDLWIERYFKSHLNLTISRYVNCGFYVIRNNHDGKAFMKLARKLLIENIRTAFFTDQDAVNMAVDRNPSKLYLLPGHFNCFRGWCRDDILERQAIHHQQDSLNFRKLRRTFNHLCLSWSAVFSGLLSR